ncbi:TonB-dependent receptor [Cryomorphaceae bacterium 1068]|nr:TonB-dependent receptor [Cryomorphaceae bacterium 1068]
MLNPTRFSLLLIFAFVSLFAQAQNGTVRGFVYEEESGEAVIFTNVYLKGTSLGAATDVNGYFSITQIPEGQYTLMVTYLGYDTLSKKIGVTAGDILTQKLFLAKSSVQMQAVEISAEKQERQTNVTMSVTKATPKQIKQIPTIGATADLAQYLQVLPGVIFTGDQGGQLYIRGGSPIQNKVLLDGATIFNPFHSIGLFSVFDTEVIKNADIYTGGFGAEYGGRISSIMDITTRDGNKRRYSGKVGFSTFAANALFEGPLKKQTNDGKSSSSFLLSAKHSYLDESSKLLYGYIDEDGLPFSFTDLYGKVSFNTANGSKFNLFGFSFNDEVQFQETSNLNWNSFGGGADFILVPSSTAALLEGGLNFSSYEITLEESAGPSNPISEGTEEVLLQPRTSAVNSFNLFLDFKYFFGDDALKYGIDISGFGTELSFFNPLGQRIEQNDNNTELAGYVTYKKKINNLILDGGFRLQYYASIRTLRPEPRLGVKYNLTENLRLKAAFGMFSQNIISANSDRDVVNLFYGFLVGPEDLQDEITLEDGSTREVKNPLQTAIHYIAGIEYDVTDRISVNLEGYFKDFTQLTNINRNKIYSSRTQDPTVPDILKNDFIVETGTAVGLDLTVGYESRKVYIWTVFSAANVDRWDGVRSYDPVFDRNYNVNLVASYRFGKGLDWEVNGRWNYGSGFPFTQNQGFYLQENLVNGLNTDITQTNSDEAQIQYAGLNEGRLPDYHRLDLTLKKTFKFSENSSLETSFSVTNTYDRENIFFVDRVTGERVNQLPILPSFGVLYSF